MFCTVLTEYRTRNPQDHLNRWRKGIWQNLSAFHEKTFNKLERERNFFNSVKGAYEHSAANIIFNGERLQAFHLRSWTRQENQVFSLLFNIALEDLTKAIRPPKKNKKIKGIQIGKEKIQLSLYRWHDTIYRKSQRLHTQKNY